MATAEELPALLAALLREGREGSLIVSDGESRKSIYLSPTGVRLLSSGKRRGVRIGEVLLKTGKITPRQLELVLEKQQKSNLRFGELLYLMCMITEDDIKQAVRTQIEEEIYDLFMWAGAKVEFREGPPPQELTDPEAPITNLTFHVSTLLEESGRRMEEYGKWRHKLPGPEVALAKLPPQPGRSELPLDDRSIQVLELCDGRRGVEQVVDSSPMFRYETLRTLALLISTGRCASGGRVMSVGMPTPEAMSSSMVAAAAAGPAAGTAPAPG
ncbi:MAG: hypothetical protein HUU15_20095, partial [Candidatus Brocadiae bacterium]|nr:hypothetical protein [Candidatus Brocadiia bacterium]